MTDDSELRHVEAALAPPHAGEVPASHGFAGRIRNYFLTGLVVAGPVAITIYLTWSFVTWVDDLVRPLFPLALRPETYLPVKIPGLGLIIAFIALTLLGFFTANFVGRKFVELGEPRPEAGVRGAVLEIGIDLPHRRARGISRARHVVAGVPVHPAGLRHHCAAAE